MMDMSTPDVWRTFRMATDANRLKAQLLGCEYRREKAGEGEGNCPCYSAYCCPFRKQIEAAPSLAQKESR